MGKDRDPGQPVEPDEVRTPGDDPDVGMRPGTEGGVGTAEASEEAPHGYYEGAPSHVLPQMPFRDMPEPLPLRKIVGPSIILTGVAVGSGEFILWPFIVSNVGIGILWAALMGVTLQYFLNMEIERYTLSTGETAVSGFSRFWKPWAILFTVGAVVPFLFPGWATGGVTMLSFITGMSEGAIPYVSVVVLIAIGLALTTSPVVYNTVEKAEFFKVGLGVLFLLVAIAAALLPRIGALGDVTQIATKFGQIPTSELVTISVVLGALVFSGAGGAINLGQSNYILDKGFGMGAYIPRIVSPITGEEVAEPSTGNMVRQDEVNIGRWRAWWRVANLEQLTTFWVISLLSIFTFSLLAYALVYGKNLAEAADFTFLQAQGQEFGRLVGGWFENFFYIFGAISLLGVAVAIIDNISRLVADALKTVYLTNASISESRIYFIVVWTMITIGSAILLLGLDQPLLLLVISSCLNGFVMVAYSALLIMLNRRALPEAIKVKGLRLVMLFVCFLFFGFFVGWLTISSVGGLLGG